MWYTKTIEWISRSLVPLLLSLVFGIVLGLFGFSSQWGAFLIFLSSIALLMGVLVRNDRYVLVSLCLLMLLLGVLRSENIIPNLDRPDLYPLYGKNMELQGVVKELSRSDYAQRLVIYIPQLDAKITTHIELFIDIEPGDTVSIKGRLDEPPELEEFDYKEHLKREGVYFLVRYPSLEVVERSSFSVTKIPFLLKESIRDGLMVISPVERGFFEALLFGEEENISKEWKDKLNVSGTRHIAAVSGMNITILTEMILFFFLSIGLWRKQASWLSVLSISIYVLMIGAPGSGVRSGIMGGLTILATQSGRLVDPERLVLITLAIMLSVSPLLVLDVGFQLSFLAFLGIVWLPSITFIQRSFAKIPDTFESRQSLLSTISAQVLVFPILLYNFGRMSIVSPISNILILPLLPFLTITGFLIGLVGNLWSWGGYVLSLIPTIVLRFIMMIVDLFSRVSFAQITLEISIVTVASIYIVLIASILYLRRRGERV